MNNQTNLNNTNSPKSNSNSFRNKFYNKNEKKESKNKNNEKRKINKENEKEKIYWHALSSNEVIKKLKSNIKGLTEFESSKRIKEYGKNEIKKIRRLYPLKIMLSQFKSFFVLLLILAAFVSALVSHFVDTYAILAIIVLNAGIGFFQDYKAEKTIQALKKMLVTRAKVMRSNTLKEINASEVVPGDILVLQEGDKVVADARIIEVRDLQTNEAVLTGESMPIDKTSKMLKPSTEVYERVNMLYKGTTVVRGSGKAIVIATGMNTEFGEVARMVQKTKSERTPLLKKIDSFAKKLGLIIIAISLIVLFAAIASGINKIQALLTSISLAVAAVPEGLPAVITICLALTVQRMYKMKSLIRKLPAAETLGRVTVICTDKTGTITGEEMTVTNLYYDNKVINTDNLIQIDNEKENASKVSEENIEGRLSNKLNNKLEGEPLGLLFKINCLCNDAYIEELGSQELKKQEEREKGKGEIGKREGEVKVTKLKIIGDPTEAALIKIAYRFGFDKKELTEKEPLVKEFPFSSTRKMMSIIRKRSRSSNSYSLTSYVKGAPDIILGKCTRELINNSVVKLTATRRQELIKIYEELATQGLRVLGFAYKSLFLQPQEKKIENIKFTEKDSEQDLIFVGFQGMLDPPRKEVKPAIEACKKAGIAVKMVTGDALLTAKAIASQIGLHGPSIEGYNLDKMSDAELSEQIRNTVIFARTTPKHKLRIVNLLKKQQEIVAVTGDGVNDAPALKRADIGIAMGIKGCDVARESSKMVLLDDNFASIVKAVKEGRRSYSNIKKFIKFLLATNFGEIEIILFSLFLGFPLPLLPLHILWINLITDSTPALALGVEPTEKGIMKQRPEPKENIIHGMLIFITIASILAFASALTAFLIFMPDLNKARTAALTTVVLFEIFFVFTCRTNKPIQKIGFFSNKFLIFAVISSIILQMIALYSPLNMVLHLNPLGIKEWPIILGLSFSGLILFEIVKNIKYKIKNKK